jgi:hypothetical protein
MCSYPAEITFGGHLVPSSWDRVVADCVDDLRGIPRR